MWRVTWRNLFARKVRLLMSGLSVILGVAFLSGVLTFSHGLSSTFDNIIHGSTPDGVVRADNQVTVQAEIEAGERQHARLSDRGQLILPGDLPLDVARHAAVAHRHRGEPPNAGPFEVDHGPGLAARAPPR